MRPDTTRPRLRASFAFLTAAALIVGVPCLLAALTGSPIPRTLPNLARLREFVAGSVGPDTLIDVLVHLLATVCWAAWALLGAVIANETIAAIQHRSTRTIGRVGGMQHIARTLVTTIAIGIASLRPTQPVDIALPARTAITVTVDHAQLAPEAAIRDEPNFHTVTSRATLLDVAQTRLGAASRWREIWELNRGRVMNDGSRFDRPEVLHRGWRLHLPTNSAVADTTPTHAAPIRVPSPEIYVVRPGDTLSEVVGQETGRPATVAEVRDVFNANRGVTDWRGAHPLHDPNLINPGMKLNLAVLRHSDGARVKTPAAKPRHVDSPPITAPSPPTTAPSPPTTAPSPPTTAPSPPTTATPSTTTKAAPTGVAPTTPPDTSTTSQSPNSNTASPPATSTEHARPNNGDGANLELLAGLALLSSAALAVGSTLRRRRLRASRPGDLARPAPANVDRVERRLRASASSHDGDRLAGALCALGDIRPQALRVRTDGTIEALLSSPLKGLPRPWTSTAGGNVAVLRAKTELPVTDMSPPATVIELGTDGDGSTIYVDLEACGGLAIDATGEPLACFARALVATLAAASHAGALHVHTHGFDATGIDPLARIEHHDEDSELRDAIAARDRDELTVVVTTTPSDLGDLDETAGLVIVGPPISGRSREWNLSLAAEGSWRLEPLGTVVTPSGLAAAELADLAAYYQHAAAPLAAAGEATLDDVDDEPSAANIANPRVRELAGDFAGSEWQLMIRTLGSVDVVNRQGVIATTDRRKAIEALVWFVEHREHGHRAAMQNALWSYEPSPDTVQNVVSEARRILRSLATPPVGEDWFDRSLHLHPLVVSDAELVAAAIKQASSQGDADAIASLETAVALIRGAPLANVAYLWADGESVPSRLTLLAVHAAAELAELHLARNDADAALRATGIGLQVLPAHEHLVCLRMHAHAARGDYASVRAEYENYESVVLRDEFSDGEISHEVASAYQRFSGPTQIRTTG